METLVWSKKNYIVPGSKRCSPWSFFVFIRRFSRAYSERSLPLQDSHSRPTSWWKSKQPFPASKPTSPLFLIFLIFSCSCWINPWGNQSDFFQGYQRSFSNCHVSFLCSAQYIMMQFSFFNIQVVFYSSMSVKFNTAKTSVTRFHNGIHCLQIFQTHLIKYKKITLDQIYPKYPV